VRDELVNALNQILKNFHLDDNQSKISLNDDQVEEKIIQLRRFDKERRASKLIERMIQYDLRKKMPRADMMMIRNKFAYKKIFKSFTHMTRMLVTLIADQSDEFQIFRDVMQRSNWSKRHDVMKREFNSLVENQT
jgi:hypothetical protein